MTANDAKNILNPAHITTIAKKLKLDPKQVSAAVVLLDDDATVPFIARYRKEATGSLDEVAITVIRDSIAQLRALDKRRKAILWAAPVLGAPLTSRLPCIRWLAYVLMRQHVSDGARDIHHPLKIP